MRIYTHTPCPNPKQIWNKNNSLKQQFMNNNTRNPTGVPTDMTD